MEDFPANSQRAKARPEARSPEERPDIERVTSAEAKRRKVGLGRQFKETFIGGNARMAVDHMMADIVVPMVRDTIAEALQGGIDRFIYGESRRRRGAYGYTPPTNSNVGHVNYQGMSTATRTSPTNPTRMLSQQSRTRHNFDEIIIQSRVEAEEVLDRMYDTLSQYGMVTVGELYALTGIRSSHTDNKWGWTRLQGAKVVPLRGRNGYLLDLPEPEAFN